MPTAKLSSLQQVVVSARLSRNGDATPQAGDLHAPAVVVALPADGPVELVIGAGDADASR